MEHADANQRPGEDCLTSKQHLGSNFDEFLAEEALLEAVTAIAVSRVIVWQIEQAT